MNRPKYASRITAGHVNSGTSLPREPLSTKAGSGRQLRTPRLHTEVDDRLPATCVGGLGVVAALWRRLGLSETIDCRVHVLVRHNPYHESDHVLAQVMNLVAGGTCIEDMASLQLDRAVLRMLGTTRFPDPTTAGDFLRRFGDPDNADALPALRAVGDEAQDKAWATLRLAPRRRRQLGSRGLVDMDSSIVPFTGNQKEGADFSYTGKWSCHPLLLTVANTSEVLAVRNRPGNAVSADGVEKLLDEHLPRVARQYEAILVRGDSGFDRASIRAVCARHGANFALVARRRDEWTALAEGLAEEAWTPWQPASRRPVDRGAHPRGYRPRQKGVDRRRAQAFRRCYMTKWKADQWVAEVQCRPTAAEQPCRLVIIRERLKHSCSPRQIVLFESYVYRFIVTDLPADMSASDVVDETYRRADQENIIEQLKNELVMWRMPVREAAGNAAWIEIARLAWNLGKWLAILALPIHTVRWEWKRLRRAFIFVAAEVLFRARQTWIRFNPSHRYIPELLLAHARLGP